ncbi:MULTISPECIES: hypothetical protein [unclassified Tolypothrix]|uniref:hypothetical protein n=1 Tax=unclassified Tolypothrix TaxID=2649714 RepID=UPI0005EAA70E|nr:MULTISPECIES: hypothetical protein [unclassified Tolypothrix]BAY92398.1 hypothetical protein NIES3275_44330 [Microchaete diplosiphon NIES-3275]EKF05917.1 hypothetical protein FDUTEX481_00268 [Tolypothrix sp. PCC 7601]MBE9086262.1 hypothetical protein [Tolypothrix sp. LEGE 11397]UYD26360.1 hypothetical protein HGR01_34600 [Tolypothrix sp. PCC 7712]UYD31404.1 hypothetical protein HG267_19905 [Tolypothrix sp. PCC 7601]
MQPPQPKSILEAALDNLPAELRNNPVFRVIYSCCFFLFMWVIIAFLFWFVFVVLLSYRNDGMKSFLYDCSTFAVGSYSSETCTTKGWVSFLLNVSSFIFTAVGLTQPDPDYK